MLLPWSSARTSSEPLTLTPCVFRFQMLTKQLCQHSSTESALSIGTSTGISACIFAILPASYKCICTVHVKHCHCFCLFAEFCLTNVNRDANHNLFSHLKIIFSQCVVQHKDKEANGIKRQRNDRYHDNSFSIIHFLVNAYCCRGKMQRIPLSECVFATIVPFRHILHSGLASNRNECITSRFSYTWVCHQSTANYSHHHSQRRRECLT